MLLAGSVACVVAALVAIALDGRAERIVIDTSHVVAGALATAAVLLRPHRDAERGWTFLGVALAAWTAGTLVWSIQDLAGRLLTVPSPGDAGILAFYALGIPAMVLIGFERGTPRRRVHTIVTTMVVAAAALLVSWVLVVPSVVGAGPVTPEIVIALAYPIMSSLMVAVCAVALQQRATITLVLLLGGMTLLALGDAVHLVVVSSGSPNTSTIADVMWPAGLALVSAAARLPTPPADRFDPGAPLLTSVAAVPVVVAATVTILAIRSGRDLDWLGAAIGFVLVTGLAALVVLADQGNRTLLAEVERGNESLAARNDDFTALLGAISDGILVVTGRGMIVWASDRAAEMLGCTTGDELVGPATLRRLDPASRARMEAARQAYLDTGEIESVLVQPAHAPELWYEAAFSPPSERDGERVVYISLRDVTRRMSTEHALGESQRQFQVAFEVAPYGMTISTMEGRIVRANQAVADIIGYSVDELIGIDVAVFTHPDDRDANDEMMEMLRLGATRSHQRIKRYLHKDGSLVHGELSLARVEIGGEPFLVGQVVDVTAELAATARLESAAVEDPLTSLANRRKVLATLEALLAAPGRRAAVLFIDLDRFKAVNDALGHAAGDELLRTIAHRLMAVVRPDDLVGRLGGDEFTIVIPDAADFEVLSIASRVRDAVAEPVRIVGEDVYVTASIGIAVASAGTVGAGDVLRDADLAMYRAKENGRSRVEWFDAETRVRVRRQHQLATDLRVALDTGGLLVHHQPIVSLGDGVIRGAEALVRLPGLPPDETSALIRAAEDSGQINELGLVVLRSAVADLRSWSSLGLAVDRFSLAINVSARQLTHPRLVPDVRDAIAEAGVSPSSVWLELTESALTSDIPAAQATLFALDRLGVRLSVDDFGTGYASLTYLAKFPVRRLKIDRSFVTGLGTPGTNEAIVVALIGLADALGIDVVAEGIETEAERSRLVELGCPHGQGYLFGRPMPPDGLTALLRAGTPAARSVPDVGG